jgi:Flp pilus assembly protein TadD
MSGRATPSRATTDQILRLLDHAATLNPDRSIDILRAQAELRAGDDAAAERTAKALVRDEPLNVYAWIVLGFASQQRDPATARLARAHQLELAPPVPSGT